MSETKELTRFERGMNAFRSVDPYTADTLMDYLQDFCPDIGRFAIEFGYGDIMSRPGLDMRTRELLNVAMLGAMGNYPAQVENHMRGALNAGATKEEILEVVIQLSAYAGFPAAFNSLGIARRIFTEGEESAS